MTGEELRAARQALGLSEQEMSLELGIPPHAYGLLEERAQRPVPRRYERQVVFLRHMQERDAALAASGLPSCPVPDQILARSTSSLKDTERQMHALGSHLDSCERCQARERFLRERFPDPVAPPQPGWVGVLGGIVDWVSRRPDWAQPAILGALVLAGLTTFRALFVLLAAPRDLRALAVAGGAILAASTAGGIGGLVYAVAGRPLRRIRRAGPYLAGIVAVGGYLLPLFGLMALLDPSSVDGGMALVVAGLLTTLFFGMLVGHSWFREG